MTRAHGAETVVHRQGESGVTRLVSLVLRLFVKPVIWLWASMPFLPWPYGLFDRVTMVLPALRGTIRTPVELPRCRAELLAPAQVSAADAAILYLHGGAFLVGGINSHRRLVSRIVSATGVPALVVDYRLLPGHSVTDGVADCLDGLDCLIAAGYPPERIAIVGDSAGGFLAAHVALLAARRGDRAGAVTMISPLVDFDPEAKASAPQGDPVFPRNAFAAFARMIDRGEQSPESMAELRTIVADPAGELATLPPTLVQVGGRERLLPDAEQFVAAMLDAGGDVRLEVYDGQFHVFQAGADLIAEGRLAIASIADHLTAALGTAGRNEAA